MFPGVSNRGPINMKLKFKEDPREWRKQVLLAAFGVALISWPFAGSLAAALPLL